MQKSVYRNDDGDIHYGANAPDGFLPCGKNDVAKALKKPGKKKPWRCNVCNDLHLGADYPDPCPTCLTNKSYVEIDIAEFKGVIGL